MKNKIITFFNSLDESTLTRLFMSYHLAKLEQVEAPTVIRTAAANKPAKRTAKKRTGAPMSEIILGTLTTTPLRPVEVANKMYQTKKIPALTARAKQYIGVELNRLAKSGRIAKDGKAYRLSA